MQCNIEVRNTMATVAKSKIDEATEKAFTEATTSAVKVDAPVPAAKTAAEAAPVKKAPAKKIIAKKAKKKPAAKKVVAKKLAAKKSTKNITAKKAPAKKAAAKKAAPKKASKKAAAPKKTFTITGLKDKIMTKNTKNFTKTVKETAADVQSRAKAAYDKSSELASDANDFNKANIEALVASGKVLAGAAQEMGRDAVADTKTVFQTVTEDAKKMAAVKSPTELFQLQGELARRNFDALVAYNSKSTEKMMKLANEAFAPVSNRMSVAAEKFSKAA